MNKRLVILNTLVSYGRSLLTVGLTLFSTRWILEALGKSDLGLYYAVGGVVVFLSFINTSMAFSSQRHFAFALGHGGTEEVQDWFNSSLSLHAMLAIAFLILSIPLGIIAFRYWLTIPEMRVVPCQWVYVCSVFTTASTILAVPFNAVYIARQHIYELTVIQVVQTFALFILAWWLLRCTSDRLRAYAIGTLAITLLVVIVQVVRCRFAFAECRVKLGKMFSWQRYKELLSFSGWSLTSTFAYILRGQGIALLLNNFGTSGANAAYGIANQVSGQAGFLANGFMGAVAPEMTTMEGRGEHDEMVKLATRACKFVTLLVLFLLVPLLTDVEPLLSVWLKEVPENTASFVRIVLIAFLAVQMVLGVTVATKAVGKIAWPEMWASLALLLAIPLAYASILAGWPIVFVVVSVALTAVLCALSTLLCARAIFKYPLRIWFGEVVVRNGVAVTVCLLANYAIHLVVPQGLLRFVMVAVLDGVILAALGWFVVLASGERSFVARKVNSLIRRFHG